MTPMEKYASDLTKWAGGVQEFLAQLPPDAQRAILGALAGGTAGGIGGYAMGGKGKKGKSTAMGALGGAAVGAGIGAGASHIPGRIGNAVKGRGYIHGQGAQDEVGDAIGGVAGSMLLSKLKTILADRKNTATMNRIGE